ncbi:hypothetical protein DMA15_03715 [Streptomyces sp. WAC 01529]|uniref:hypothetical protein n=1 Tax=Streptomyces sp. WAC 01529 TaxID=2203205 RepID=UPI000F71A698|nr:hypothetical protein [Streptomyces sp. WAC 01529]AZM51801.1 hypothetical protein DMA15_03715 [Streptomyces sp. WAC 01529]
MRSRTHATPCDYGLSGPGGTAPCICGVSAAQLSADQLIRTVALEAAVSLDMEISPSEVLNIARRFETYLRGER